jgi:tetratricopeptide (TPR) repeat protein
MLRPCFLVIALLVVSASFSQQYELDSLLRILNNYSREDTTRLQLLNDIAFNYSRIDPEKGSAIADEAMLLAKKLNDIKKLASAHSYKAMNLAGMGEDSMALNYYLRALALHEQVHDRLHMATTYNNMAIEFVNLADYIRALEFHEKAYKIFESLDDKIRMGNSLNNRGVIYLYLSDYSQALKYHLDALSIFEQLDNKHITAATLSNVGLVYDHLSDFTKALQYQQKAYELYKESGDKQGMINSLGNVGNVYHNLEQNEQALNYYQKALTISEQIGDKRGIASNRSNIGIVYSGTGNFAKALDYLEKSLQINTISGDKKRIAGDLNEIGKVYLIATDSFLATRKISPQTRLDHVIGYQTRSLQIAREIGSLDLQRESLNILSRVYEKDKQPGKALEYYKEYIVLRDSVLNSEVKQNINRREMQFEYEKKEVLLKADQQRKQTAAQSDINRQKLVKNTTISIAAVLLAAGMASFVFYKRKRDADVKSRETEFKLKESETEMDVLRLQMNPHFIFNSLNSINHYINHHDTGTATLYTTKFAKLMRMTLESSAKKEICLSEDLAALELYLQLESLRLRHSFTYEINVGGDINADTTMVPPMLLQPFVENSIWHGVSKKDNGRILIHIKKEDQMLHCTVEDNGAGRNGAPGNIGKNSLGTSITKKRIDILNQIKKTHANIALQDLEHGMRVEVTIPFESWS